MPAHTPAPWRVARGRAVYAVQTPDDRAVCTLWQDGDEQAANARLIAAAPDMLAALERIARTAGTTTDATATLALVQTIGAIAETAITTATEEE